jgi:gluconokinase
VLFNNDGKAVSRFGIEYPLYTPTPATAEQDPKEIFQAVVTVIKNCLTKANVSGDDVRFVSCSSAMHSLIIIDGEVNPLT